MTNRGKVIAVSVVALLLGSMLTLEILSRQTITIEMIDSGYKPSKITIQTGQKVIWKNVGQMERWPASNSHPTHQNYPSENTGCLGSELDACKAMKNGETYEFVFDEPGSWGMHDHLSPNDGMIVNVSETGRGWLGKLKLLIQSITAQKSTTRNISAEQFRSLDYGTQSTTLKELAATNPSAAWELIKEAFIINGQVAKDIHEFAHIVGHAAYEKDGIKGVSICDESFAYGCFHGVAEEAITSRGERAITEIEQACTDTLDEARRPSCYHGIGHGTAGIHKLQLQPALTACDRLQEANQTYCFDGVFMEHTTASKESGITRDAPWKLCESIPPKYHTACARYQPNRLMNLNYDFAGGIATCGQTAFALLKEHCARGYGFLSVRQSNFSPSLINDLCSGANDIAATDWCMIAAATELTFQSYAGWEQSAPEVCSFIKTDVSRSECEYTIASMQSGGVRL